MLIQIPQLNDHQLNQLDQLCAHCKSVDGNLVATYRHLLGRNRQRPANILYQKSADDNQLTAFLGAFFFLETSCEIALMVAPHCRGQGIAKQLIQAILPLAQSEKTKQFIFSSPHQLNTPWLKAAGFAYRNSEFEMIRTGRNSHSGYTAPPFIRIATHHDISALQAIEAACFATHKNSHSMPFQDLLFNPEYTIFVIEHDQQLVGKAHINWQPDEARFSDIAVLPHYQHRGLATALLTNCIHHVHSKHQYNIILDVETTNAGALELYTRLGFTIHNAHDYWSIDELGLTDFLQPL